MKFRRFAAVLLSCLVCWANAWAAPAAENAESFTHPGPILSAFIVRSGSKLPLYQVPHLHKGDKLVVDTDKSTVGKSRWVMVLATVAPAGTHVETHRFDLSDEAEERSIDIGTDDEVPVIVLAPQIDSFFGLSTSFSQSASLIADAISTDPQRFVDLQKVDQINQTINILSAELELALQTQSREHAAEVVRNLAAKFGLKNVNSDCFKAESVNTECVANDIVSNKETTVPAVDELGALAGPLSNAKLSPDMFIDSRIVTATSEYLANKYRDQYTFAPSLGKRLGNGPKLQLFTKARLKTGNVKTAYVYVPGWFTGKIPVSSIAGGALPCLSAGEIKLNLAGRLPSQNYWHDWQLILQDSEGTTTNLAPARDFTFDPAKGSLQFNAADTLNHIDMHGQLLDAKLSAKFGFESFELPAFRIALPRLTHPESHMQGLETLIAGEKAKLHFAGADSDACVETVELTVDQKNLAVSGREHKNGIDVDLSAALPGEASLKIKQFGLPAQLTPVRVLQRRAHVQRIEHHDLETSLTVLGEGLERIDTIKLGSLQCRPDSTSHEASVGVRVFNCPTGAADNAKLPAQATIVHLDQEPASYELPIEKLVARPHIQLAGTEAIKVLLSPKAVQWGLHENGALVSDDSGLSLLLRGVDGYQLLHGTYALQLKFTDDPQTEQTPISFTLSENRAHNELRTRTPIVLPHAQLPSIVNPIWYRVQHEQTGFVGDWQPLNRSIVTLPSLGEVSCAPGGNSLLIHGDELDEIDWVSADITRNAAASPSAGKKANPITPCDKGQCLNVDHLTQDGRLRVKIHWIDDRVFDVSFGDVPTCTSSAL